MFVAKQQQQVVPVMAAKPVQVIAAAQPVQQVQPVQVVQAPQIVQQAPVAVPMPAPYHKHKKSFCTPWRCCITGALILFAILALTAILLAIFLRPRGDEGKVGDCAEGYVKNNMGKCEDIDECVAGYSVCSHKCVNTAGSYTCACYGGYQIGMDGRTCTDKNECLDSNGGCDQDCVNNLGSYSCSCSQPGTQLDANGHACRDINECAINNGGCDDYCKNTHGSYYCSCREGYYLAPDGKNCMDINECDENNGGCEGECYNNEGSFSCDCAEGYELLDNNDSCIDIDECALDTDGCEEGCVNTPGSYYCVCGDGYELDDDAQSCVDYDECGFNNGYCSHTCVNDPPGSYTCTCPDGYFLNNDMVTCGDINECETNNGGCSHICVNTPGSYHCDCPTGSNLILFDNGEKCGFDLGDCCSGTPCNIYADDLPNAVPSGWILSPNYPNNYMNGQTCDVIITPVQGGDVVSLTNLFLDTEASSDTVDIYDGSLTSDPSLGSESGLTSGATFVATNLGGVLRLVFTSDGDTVDDGFTYSYTTQPGN